MKPHTNPDVTETASAPKRRLQRPGYTAGETVLTHTTSGEPILCTVIERDWLTDEWLLASPAHGYAIQRAALEMEWSNSRDQRPGPQNAMIATETLKPGSLHPIVRAHSGDCTIYSALINKRPEDGICTCGYGWTLVHAGDWSEMYSKERAAAMRKRCPLCQRSRYGGRKVCACGYDFTASLRPND